MSERKPREFTDAPAVRSKVPVLFGITGASSSGKTFSALRLATGIQRVTGGDIFFVDTEANRALHYASRFKFRHVPFSAPFGSWDYLDVLRDCSKKGSSITIVDSFSHEHEGAGGYLDFHEQEVERLMKAWNTNAMKVQIPAWGQPAKRRRDLINGMLQLNSNFIFCFRAKEKLKIVTGKDPLPLGWMPIGGEEFIYELLANALLMPGASGIPTWEPAEVGEKKMVKNPEQFRKLFGAAAKGPLDENLGEQIALWASGKSIDGPAAPASPPPPSQPRTPTPHDLAVEILRTSTSLQDLGKKWEAINPEVRNAPRVSKVKDELKAKFTAPPPQREPGDDEDADQDPNRWN